MKVTFDAFRNAGFKLIGMDELSHPSGEGSLPFASVDIARCDIDNMLVSKCAWRKNTGVQPVPDDCPVICQSASEPNVVSELMACNVDWELDNCEQFKWKPDLAKLAKMLSEEKSESEPNKIDFSSPDSDADIVFVLSGLLKCESNQIIREIVHLKSSHAEYAKLIAKLKAEKNPHDHTAEFDAVVFGSDKKEWNGEGFVNAGELCDCRIKRKGVWEDWVTDSYIVHSCNGLMWVKWGCIDELVSIGEVEFRKYGETERLAKRNEAGRDLYVLYTQVRSYGYSVVDWEALGEAVQEQWRKLAERVTVNDWSDDDLPY